MSVFTNAAGSAAAEGRAYTRALLDLLGDRDPRAVLGEQAQWLHDTLAERPRAALLRPERAGKWSVGQVLQFGHGRGVGRDRPIIQPLEIVDRALGRRLQQLAHGYAPATIDAAIGGGCRSVWSTTQ